MLLTDPSSNLARCPRRDGHPAGLFSAALLLFAVACGREAPENRTHEVVEIRGIPDLTIGAEDRGDDYIFASVTGVAIDGDGRILVADAGSDNVRAYSDDGGFLFRVAGKGSGPGEVLGPCCLAIGPDGLLWVRDTGNARYNAYALSDSNAVYRSSIRMAHSAAGLFAPITFDSLGQLIDVGMRSIPETPRAGTIRFYRTPNGDVADSVVVPAPPEGTVAMHAIDVQSGGARVRGYVHQPFGSQHLVAHSPTGEWATAITSNYAITWFAADGTEIRTIAREVTGPELSSAETRRADSVLAQRARRFGATLRDLPFGVPDRKAPVRAIFFDRVGRLWVERAVAEGQPRVADVFERDGVHATTVEWAANIDLARGAIRRALAVAPAENELGVDYVVRLRFD
ncbi:MAG: hypothetical protein ACRENI_13340 [Gemmatimonadaceae bacterium]